MNFIPQPSLEHIATLKIVVTLWNQNDVRALIKNYSFPVFRCDKRKEWQKMENKVLGKVRKLSLPERLKEKIIGFIRPVGLEIMKWMQNHLKDNNFGLHLPDEFFFTSHGTVNLQKTAELLIKDESLPIETRYRLACMYCLKDCTQELWNKLPDDSKHSFYREEGPEHINEHLFVRFFTYAVKGELDKIDSMIKNKYHDSLYLRMFKQAIYDANKVATEYFFKYVTPKEKNIHLLYLAKAAADGTSGPYFVDVLFFLLSQMDQKEQIYILSKKPYELLLCILDWPRQSRFIETIIYMDNFLPQSFYENALQKIIQKVMDGFKDCYYQNIFSKLWMLLPDDNRHYIINQCFSGSLLSNLNQCFSGGLLSNLFKIKDKENIKLVLKDATPELKKELIFKSQGSIICERLINEGELDLLELFIQSCLSTKDEIMRFKDYFDERPSCVSKRNRNWNNFFCFIEKLVCKYDKRKSEEMNSNPVKKFRNAKSNKQ